MSLPNFVKIVDGMPTINIGAMRHQVTVLAQLPSNPPVTDASGIIQPWQPIAPPMWAAIGSEAAGSIRQGGDVIKGDQTTAQSYFFVAMWWVDSISSSMRLTTENGLTLVIQSIENLLEMNAVLVLTCLGIGDNG